MDPANDTENSSTWALNETDSPEIFIFLSVVNDLPNIMMIALGFFVASSGLLCNGFVLEAVLKAPSTRLKPKLLLVNSLIIDALCPLPYCILTTAYIVKAFGVTDLNTFACMEGLKDVFAPLLQYAYALSSLALALDRLYAVLAPIQYFVRSHDYISCIVISIVWLVSIGLVFPIGVIVFSGFHQTENVCWRLVTSHRNWTNLLRFPIYIGLSAISLVVYISAFIVWLYRQRILNGTNYTSHHKQSGSMAFTFFVVQISSVCRFLPVPLLRIVEMFSGAKIDLNMFILAKHVLELLVNFNCTINPIIIVRRTPVIREALYAIGQPKRPITYSLPPKISSSFNRSVTRDRMGSCESYC